MAIALIQSKTAQKGGGFTSISAQFNSNTAAGSLLLATYTVTSISGVSFTYSDTDGHTFNSAGAIQGGATAGMFWTGNIAGGTKDTITLTCSSAANGGMSLCISEWSGCLAAADPSDQTNHQQAGGANSGNTNSVVTTVDNELAVGTLLLGSSVAGLADAAGWTNLCSLGMSSGPSNDTEYKLISPAGTVSASWTWSNPQAYNAIIVTFKPPATSDLPLNERMAVDLPALVAQRAARAAYEVPARWPIEDANPEGSEIIANRHMIYQPMRG
jgi:hypothetical protein